MVPRQQKYLFLINSFLAGGAERSLLALLPTLVETGVEPVIVALRVSQTGFEREIAEAGYDYRVLPARGLLRQALELRRLVRNEQPDLVYTSLFEADLVGRVGCIGLEVPVVSNIANTSYDEARLGDPNVDKLRLEIVRIVDSLTARYLTDHFHAVSQAAKDSAVAKMGLDPSRVTVVRRGRDQDTIGAPGAERKSAARAMLGIERDAELVVSVGRQEYQKGHRHLIEAFQGVTRRRPAAVLLIAGRPGRETVSLRSLIEHLGLSRRVTLLGHRDDIPEILAAADVFAFPSLYEGLGGALIEAMASALPVVASDLPAIREVVEPGRNALVVPPGDPRALEAALVDLLSDVTRLRQFGERSREIFKGSFRLEEANRELIALLASIARPSGRSHEQPR